MIYLPRRKFTFMLRVSIDCVNKLVYILIETVFFSFFSPFLYLSFYCFFVFSILNKIGYRDGCLRTKFLIVSDTLLRLKYPRLHELTIKKIKLKKTVPQILSESEGGAYNFTTVGVDGAGVTTATLAGLRPHARYSVVLQAFNSRGAGPASPPALGTTLEDSKFCAGN